eukprot:GHVT01062741.1.p1 GENE.GHVT01062741.1~~GHVT01062741.1.p1  ORF type:complete len:208 (+),score=46.22 GHVT01062741.1:586-1209(+)
MHAAMQGVGSFAGERVAFGARAPPRRSWLPSAAVRRLFLLASSAPLLLLAAGCRLACAGLAPEASGSPGGSPAAPAVGPKFHAPASVAARLPLPLPTYGECAAGAEYVITSTAQLLDGAIIAHLPCIFSVAEPPTRVPLGFLYGNLLSIANSGTRNRQLNFGPGIRKTTRASGQLNFGIVWLDIPLVRRKYGADFSACVVRGLCEAD